MKKQLTPKEKIEYSYMLSLLSSCVNATEVLPFPKDVSFEKLSYIADKCRVKAMFADSLLRLKDKSCLTEENILELNDLKNQQLLIDGVLDYEVEKLLLLFEKNKIVNLPVKGYFLKHEYPQGNFRSVSDFDILFDISQIEDVNKVFKELDYTFIESDDTQYHFQKKPYMYIEMHYSLVHKREHYYPFLKNQLGRSIKRENYEYSRQMSPEDFYLYLLIHHSNHMRIAGMGIRMILDIYVYYKNHKDEFDFDYLNEKLKKYELDKFEKSIREIAFNWFSDEKPKVSFNDLENYILLSFTLGRTDVATMVDSVKHNDSESNSKFAKFKYIVSSAFPKIEIMKMRYKYLEKAPFLLPLSWIMMWSRRIFIDKNLNIKNGYKNRMNYSDDDVQYLKKVLNSVGFKKIGF